MDPLNLEIVRANPTAPEIDALIRAHIARSRKYYPVESCHSYGGAELSELGVVLFAGRVNGHAVSIGGYIPLSDTAVEMKSVFTAKSARGKGYGLALVRHLMSEARDAGYLNFCLETGNDDASAAARAVYEKLGFQYRGPFGSYVEDPFSAFMQATL